MLSWPESLSSRLYLYTDRHRTEVSASCAAAFSLLLLLAYCYCKYGVQYYMLSTWVATQKWLHPNSGLRPNSDVVADSWEKQIIKMHVIKIIIKNIYKLIVYIIKKNMHFRVCIIFCSPRLHKNSNIAK